MVGVSIKSLLRVLERGEYDLVAVFALAWLFLCVTSPYCGMHGLPLLHMGYESNCDCGSVVSKTLE